MNGPPPNVDSRTLLAQLSERPRPSKVVPFKFDGTGVERVRIIVAPATANLQSQNNAHKRLRDEFKLPLNEWETETGRAMLGDLSAKEMIAFWVYEEAEIAPGKYKRLFGDSKDVERSLSGDEIAVLFDLCQQTQFELGPRMRVMTDADVEAWIEKLKDGFDFLAYLQLPDLHELIRGLHRRLVSSAHGTPSPDSQLSSLLDSGELSQETSATDITSSGEPLDELAAGLITSRNLTPAEAMAIARQLAGHD